MNDSDELLAASPTQSPTISDNTWSPTTFPTDNFSMLGVNNIHVENLCLKEGKYKFKVNDIAGNGLCCVEGEGHYNLTSYGDVIVQGGEFEYSESTLFEIPFVPSTSESTIPILKPSALPSLD